ncbi:DUF768 domain-containing protein [Mesorhizobium silamurunense]|uniref:DUF768 domain-containing protein n=1 Tax=Mesorhizobium silamurunense TaxID=499528 RepID=UPI0028AD820F|nr:hypothetical protein [Mesorhizobium silamurunense]
MSALLRAAQPESSPSSLTVAGSRIFGTLGNRAMSKRGAEFFGQWITDNVIRGSVGADIISVSELTDKLFSDAKLAGVSEQEIEEEVGSAYEAILAAIVGRDGA